MSPLRKLPLLTTAALATMTAAGQLQAVSHFYDDADRLVRTVHENGEAVSYSYDDADNLIAVARLTLPAAPGDFTATRTSPTAAGLAWDDIAGDETGYRVFRRPAGDYSWETVADLPAGATGYADEGLSPGEQYVYRAVALGTGGLTSAYSREAAAAGSGGEVFSIRSFARGTAPAASTFELRFDAIGTSVYNLQTNPGLATGAWSPAPFSLSPAGPFDQTSLTGTTGPVVIYIDASDTERYFRITREG